jgi:hypothetical protein
VVPKDSAVIGGELRQVALHGNHVQIAKFSDNGDPNFKTVSDILRLLIKSISNDEKISKYSI